MKHHLVKKDDQWVCERCGKPLPATDNEAEAMKALDEECQGFRGARFSFTARRAFFAFLDEKDNRSTVDPTVTPGMYRLRGILPPYEDCDTKGTRLLKSAGYEECDKK